jgi:hypothetical protein
MVVIVQLTISQVISNPCPCSHSMLSFAFEMLVYSVCSAGQYQTTNATSTSDRVCAACPAGHHCAGGVFPPLPCGGPSKYAAPSQASCATVDVGYYTLPLNSTLATSQLPCPVGSSCVNGLLRACPSNFFQNLPQQPACSPCQVCASGQVTLVSCSNSSDTVCIGKIRSTFPLTAYSCVVAVYIALSMP